MKIHNLQMQKVYNIDPSPIYDKSKQIKQERYDWFFWIWVLQTHVYAQSLKVSSKNQFTNRKVHNNFCFKNFVWKWFTAAPLEHEAHGLPDQD